jgi:uncharacterized membrane protein
MTINKDHSENDQDGLLIKPAERSVGARLRGYLIAGILITAYLSISLIQFIDARVVGFIPPAYNPNEYLPFSVPGLGVIVVLLFLITVGMITANFFGRFFIRLSEGILDRMPIIRSLYGATKQILETVLATQSNAFRDVILFEYPRKGLWCIGFITASTKGEVARVTEEDTVNVFVPTTPNPTSGFLLFVPRKDIKILDMSVEEGVKLVVSAGIITPSDKSIKVKHSETKKTSSK